MKDLTLEKLAEQLMKNKAEIYGKMKDLNESYQDLKTELEDFEARVGDIKSELHKHEAQRSEYTAEITKEVKELKNLIIANDNRFAKHDEAEMKKYDLIVKSIDRLTDSLVAVKDETDGNSKALRQKRIEEEKQRAIDEALALHDAPLQEVKKKAIMSIVGVISVAVAVGMWKLIMFVSTTDKLLNGE